MKYDYIFSGFGLSSILVLRELLEQGLIEGKRILILEKESTFKEQTWCFWEKGPGLWDEILSGKWEKGFFVDGALRKELLDGLTYKSITGSGLRKWMIHALKNHSVTFANEAVSGWTDGVNGVSVHTLNAVYSGRFLFNSVNLEVNKPLKSKLLLQHFEGWYIKADNLPFDASEAIIMDFTIPQKGNTRFMYVLPFTENFALVEYTLFSRTLLPKEEYRDELVRYLDRLGVADYEITSRESGVVPMTTHPFWQYNGRNVLHIGTAGGWTKASTGYTFANAVKMSRKLAAWLQNETPDFRKFHQISRFNWYDELFISVLWRDNAVGKKLFRTLFLKSQSNEVLRFLNEETNWVDEAKIILACPKRPFLSALIQMLLKNSTRTGLGDSLKTQKC